jgi:hypothetical protein
MRGGASAGFVSRTGRRAIVGEFPPSGAGFVAIVPAARADATKTRAQGAFRSNRARGASDCDVPHL